MNRREFFTRINPFQGDAPTGNDATITERKAAVQNDLFRLAMARGIDPATVDPERLPELLGLKAGKT